MKLVAVSQRVDVLAERKERRDALDQRLVHWLDLADLLAVPVPNTLGISSGDQETRRRKLDAWLTAVRPETIVLSGGNDVGEAPERDASEMQLLDWARAKCIPVLAICRGMQMMGIWAGAELKPVTGHVRTRHRLQGPGGEYPGTVNSYHQFALAETPAGFVALARAEDGTLEAMRHESLPWLAWMWHPERESPFDKTHLDELNRLLQAIGKDLGNKRE